MYRIYTFKSRMLHKFTPYFILNFQCFSLNKINYVSSINNEGNTIKTHGIYQPETKRVGSLSPQEILNILIEFIPNFYVSC